jgi:hypothetical protein
MPTLFVVGPYRIVIYLNDHAPAHVHAVGPDGYARFELGMTRDGVALTESEGIPRATLRRIAAAIIDRHAECAACWRKVHGGNVTSRKGS